MTHIREFPPPPGTDASVENVGNGRKSLMSEVNTDDCNGTIAVFTFELLPR